MMLITTKSTKNINGSYSVAKKKLNESEIYSNTSELTISTNKEMSFRIGAKFQKKKNAEYVHN